MISYSIMKIKQMFTLYKRRFWLIINLKISIFLIIYIVNCLNWILINIKMHSTSSLILKTFILTFLICYYILNWKLTFSFFYFISIWIRLTMIILFITFKIISRWIMLISNRRSHWNMLSDVSLTSLLIFFWT